MTMAADFKQTVKLRLLSAFHAFLLLTITQQGLILIAFLLLMPILHKSLISLFGVYSFFLLGFYFGWIRWSNRNFSPVKAEPHLTIIAIVKEIIAIIDSFIDFFPTNDRRDSTPADGESRRGSETVDVLNFDHEFALFLEFFASDFIDSWFVEIAVDPELKEKILGTLKLIGDDVVTRISRLDRDVTTTKILRAYQTFLFQVNESRKSLKTKSLFDSNRRLKRVHTVEEAYDINFGLHPVVRSLTSPGGFVSDRSPIKRIKRKSTSSSRRFSSAISPSVPSVSQYDYFYSLLDLVLEVQTASMQDGKPLHVSRLTKDALADVVSNGALPLLPKLADPAFLFECVSDLVAPTCPDTYIALVEEERKWFALRKGETGLDAGIPLHELSPSRNSLTSLDTKADGDDMFSLEREPSVSCSSAGTSAEENENDTPGVLPEVASSESLNGQETLEVSDLLTEPLEPLPPPKFVFSQFGEYVEISFSTPVLSASQEAALNDAFGDDDEEQVEPRVEATICDLQESDRIDVPVCDLPGTADKENRSLSSSPPITENNQEKSGCFRASCPNLSVEINKLGSDSLPTDASGEYDCFSVGELPVEKSQHFKPHLFSPAPEQDLTSSGAEQLDRESISSADGAVAPSTTNMDRLFLSIMIPDTVLCRDPNSGIKYTLYVIHYTAVYPCGLGGALEPRAGAVKRRFREFLTLHERLDNSNSFKYSLKGIKGPSKWAGPFPWTNFSKDLIEGRRKALEIYLKSLAALTDISCSQPLREFLAYDSDPRIAYVQKAPSYTSMFNLDKFFTKGLTGSLEGVFMPQPSKSGPPTPPITRRETGGVLVTQAEANRNDGHEYHPTGAKDVYIKTAAPLLRGKDLSGPSSANASRAQSPRTLKSSESSSHLASNLALAVGALGDDEQLLRKGLLEVQFSPARRKSDGDSSLTPLHVPFGPHFRWGPRGRKEQLMYQNYRSLKPSVASHGRNLEKQCGYYSVKRLSNGKDERKDEDLTDLLFPKNAAESEENEDAFFDAAEELVESEVETEEEPSLETAVLNVVLDIVFEAMRSRPSWFNHETFLSKSKLVFGALIDHVIKSEVENVTTRTRWAYYLGLLRVTLWPKVETPPQVRDVEEARKKAFGDLTKLLPYPAMDILGTCEVLSAVEAIFDSVSYYNLNLHFIFTTLEIVLQDLFPEVDFAEQLSIKLDKIVSL